MQQQVVLRGARELARRSARAQCDGLLGQRHDVSRQFVNPWRRSSVDLAYEPNTFLRATRLRLPYLSSMPLLV